MSRLRPKPMLAVAAFALLAIVLSACTFYKPGSFSLSQPSGIGSVRVHFVLCSSLDEEGVTCTANDEEGGNQSMLGIAVSKGAAAPATITATPLSGGPSIVYSRDDQVAQEFAEASQETGTPWPPAGTEGIGYRSAAFPEEVGLREWAVDADFGLPAAADGGPSAEPFQVSVWVGSRELGEGETGDHPVVCHPEDEPWQPEDVGEADCEFADAGTLGVSDLKIGTAAQGAAFLGGKGTLSFPLEFASSATSLPTFGLSATSTLPGAKLALSSPTFTPGAPDPTTRRSPAATGTVTVTVPKNAKPGTYDVTLTAATPQGGTVSQVAQLKVTKAKLSLGGVKLNKTKGTATLSVKIPGAGTVTASGKGIAKVKKAAKKATKPKTVKLRIKAKGKAKKQLAEEGAAKVSAKITFKPLSGIAVTKTRKLTLQKN